MLNNFLFIQICPVFERSGTVKNYGHILRAFSVTYKLSNIVAFRHKVEYCLNTVCFLEGDVNEIDGAL
jgi:NADH:ubiquinone oxidoreductase subunit E